MPKKLSEIVSEIGTKYEQAQGILYRRAADESKACAVCALGGIALLSDPTRFKPQFDGYSLYDAQKTKIEDDCTAHYVDILRAAGVDEADLYRDIPYEVTLKVNGKAHDVNSCSLSSFIFSLNDAGADFDLIAWILKEYGL